MLALFMGFASVLQVSADCFKASCATLGYNVCASFSGSELNMNVLNCTEGLHCSIFETHHWAQLRAQAGDNDGTLWCSDSEYDPPSPIFDASQVTCGSRDPRQTLVEGVYPKQCESPMDCELQNGEYSNCECGLDGFSYCAIEWGSTVMSDFWNACNNSTNLIDASDYKYWNEYRKIYIFDKTKPICAAALFDEFQFLADSTGVLMSVALAGLIS